MSKRIINPIGIAVLDMVSNALAAAIILFICIAALREPVLPPERAKATLTIQAFSGEALDHCRKKTRFRPVRRSLRTSS